MDLVDFGNGTAGIRGSISRRLVVAGRWRRRSSNCFLANGCGMLDGTAWLEGSGPDSDWRTFACASSLPTTRATCLTFRPPPPSLSFTARH